MKHIHHFSLLTLILFCYISCRPEKTKSINQIAVSSNEITKPSPVYPLRIDYLHSFEDSTTYYFCSARVKTGLKDDYYNIIEKEAFKHLVKQYDEYTSRYEIIPEHSRKYLEIEKEIWVYNIHCQFIAKGTFVRHELYDEATDTEIISVYTLDFESEEKGSKNLPSFYANMKSENENRVRSIEKSTLSAPEKKLLKNSENLQWFGKEDIMTFQYEYNKEKFTFHSNGNIQIFSKSSETKLVFYLENAMIQDMTSTHFLQNDKPVFLLSCAQPETDYFYQIAVAWNGNEFAIL